MDQQYIFKLAISIAEQMANDDHDLFNRISHSELPALRSETRKTAKRIYDNWVDLQSIVLRHESTIQRRWTKKSKLKRRELLLTTWPNMSRDHRPDIVLMNKRNTQSDLKKATDGLLNAGPSELKTYQGSQREALLMPYINLHDLTKTEPLLLMINGRARQPPHAFAKRDLQFTTHNIGVTGWRFLVGYVMSFDGRQSFPAAYGELREGKWKEVVTPTGADPRIAGETINPGDGLWVLEIQDRIYKFLLDITQRILHDIPAGDLNGPKYTIQPEPPLPSANYREDGVASLASTNLEAIYSAPGGMDLHRLQLLVAAKANEEEDNLWDLREDPGRFSEGLKDFIAHQAGFVPDLSGKQNVAAIIDECRIEMDSDTMTPEAMFGLRFLLINFESVAFWSYLARKIASLVELKKKVFDNRQIESSDPLPESFKMELYKFQYVLCVSIEGRLSILRRKAYSSPPLRPYFRRASPDTLDDFVRNPDKKLPQHISDFLSFLRILCRKDYLKTMGHIASVQSLLEEYDTFVNANPDAREAVSSHMAQEISSLALLSECLRQIHLFEPWAATSYKDLETRRAQESLSSELHELKREIRPVQTLNASVHVWSMPTEIVKSTYPVHKKRTAANVDAMQSAEMLLDQMWDALLAELEQQNALPTHVKNVLFSQGRQLQRTPDWVEPAKPVKKTALQSATPDVLVPSFGELNIVDARKVQDSSREKTKIKTRGTAAPQAPPQAAEQEEPGPAPTIQVDRRALKVFRTIFHTPSSTSQPGELPWRDFLHAMRSAGFGMESLQGSAWQFTPQNDSGSGMGAGKRSILFHEPHPKSRIPILHAKTLGRRLARTYGWSGETFVAK